MATTTRAGTGGIEVGGAASVAVEHGGGQAAPALVVEWDFDNDGDYDDPTEDITAYVMSAETAAGRDFPSALTGQAGPGQLKLTVNNADGRFNYWNDDSPLNADGRSLDTGRRIRIRTAESTPVDPVLLVRDRFKRADGTLGSAETGHAWTVALGGFAVVGQSARAVANYGASSFATVAAGAADVYVQAAVSQVHAARFAGLVARFVDVFSHVGMYVDAAAAQVVMYRLAAGVLTHSFSYDVDPWEGMTIGLEAAGTSLAAYVGGVPVIDRAVPADAGTKAGLRAHHNENESERPPEFADFHVWDRVAGEVDGVLWTGDVKAVQPKVVPGFSVAQIDGEGVLARAARPVVAAPRLPRAGAPTGLIVGDVLARANLAHPPAPLAAGTTVTGPVGIDDSKAIDLARQLEAVERGFVHETNEGQVGYHDAATRESASSEAWFSDTPGVGQFRYSAVDPIDHRGRIVNRVTTGVAPAAPGPVSVTTDVGSGHVDVTMPTVNHGDLLFVFVSNTNNGGHEWLTPIWWAVHRDLKAALGLRIYSHWCDGTESGTNVRFYQHNGAESGLWAAMIYRVESWFGSYDGIAVSDVVSGRDAPGLTHNFGRAPALYIAAQAGIGGRAGGMVFEPDVFTPALYDLSSPGGVITSSGVVGFDAGLASAYKIDCTDAEDASEFVSIRNALIAEAVVVAIRGYNGPHTKATLDNPRTVGGDGRPVTVEDQASQDRHNTIVTHETPALYASESDATAAADAIIAGYADARPIVAITFPATLDAAHRAQAIRRRVGDKITLTASGATGLGVEGDFYIEHVAHEWPDTKRWQVTWQLSPT